MDPQPATPIVGYTHGADTFCIDCFDAYLDSAVDSRIADLDWLNREYGWPSQDHDRGATRDDLLNREIEAMLATDQHDRYPFCEECGTKITDVRLTPEGMAYERCQGEDN